MFNIILYEPEIPPNTGNIIRLCANTGTSLHLILGETRVYALSTRGGTGYATAQFQAGDSFLFGPETRGLGQTLLDALPAGQTLRLPMRPDNRSLNLSNAVAVVIYEAWRQCGFAGGA